MLLTFLNGFRFPIGRISCCFILLIIHLIFLVLIILIVFIVSFLDVVVVNIVVGVLHRGLERKFASAGSSDDLLDASESTRELRREKRRSFGGEGGGAWRSRNDLEERRWMSGNSSNKGH